MKLSNIFKKEDKTFSKVKVESLNNAQLSKVIGGTDEVLLTETTTNTSDVLKTKHETALNSVGNIRA